MLTHILKIKITLNVLKSIVLFCDEVGCTFKILSSIGALYIEENILVGTVLGLTLVWSSSS